jgi:hypothetical protein
MKPGFARSKSQLVLKSSIVELDPPADMKGLKLRPSKNRVAPAPVW